MELGRYRKFVVAIVGATVAGLYAYFGPANPNVATFVAVVTALGVYAVPNA